MYVSSFSGDNLCHLVDRQEEGQLVRKDKTHGSRPTGLKCGMKAKIRSVWEWMKVVKM